MPLQAKRLRNFRTGRVSARAEARTQRILRDNLERRFFKRLDALFRKFLRVNMFLFKRYGIYEPQIAQGALNEDLIPMVFSHYKRITRVIYEHNERKHNKKDVFVFGRAVDFERRVEEYFAGRQFVFVGITNIIATKISNEIVRLRGEGLSNTQIASAIVDKFSGINLRRARTIARTETHNAAGFANHAYHEEVESNLGTRMFKKWVATEDERTRTHHAEMNSKPPIPMNEDFVVGGVKMKYAGDPKGGAKNVINCRCVIIYIDEEDVVT